MLLVDDEHPGRASQAGAGIVSPQTSNDPDEEWFAYGLRAADHLERLIERLAEDGADPGGVAFARCGSLAVSLAEHEDRWFSEALALATRRSSSVREIPEREARELLPIVARTWRVMHNPLGARVDGRRLCVAIKQAARKKGASILATEVVGVDQRDGRITGVLVKEGVVNCGALVLAAGAWTARATKWFGVELPLYPTKGQIVHLGLDGRFQSDRRGAGSDRWPILQPILNFYLVPWPGGRIACGGTFEAEAGFDVRPTAAGLRDLLRECLVLAPPLAEASFLEVRVGLRPTSRDDRPLMGLLPGTTNVHVCTGHGAHGLHTGPYSAALVAGSLLGTVSPERLPYGIARFTPANPAHAKSLGQAASPQ